MGRWKGNCRPANAIAVHPSANTYLPAPSLTQWRKTITFTLARQPHRGGVARFRTVWTGGLHTGGFCSCFPALCFFGHTESELPQPPALPRNRVCPLEAEQAAEIETFPAKGHPDWTLPPRSSCPFSCNCIFVTWELRFSVQEHRRNVACVCLG